MSKRFEQAGAAESSPAEIPQPYALPQAPPAPAQTMAVQSGPDYLMWLLAAAFLATVAWLAWTF
jgi:hypothetical protein